MIFIEHSLRGEATITYSFLAGDRGSPTRLPHESPHYTISTNQHHDTMPLLRRTAINVYCYHDHFNTRPSIQFTTNLSVHSMMCSKIAFDFQIYFTLVFTFDCCFHFIFGQIFKIYCLKSSILNSQYFSINTHFNNIVCILYNNEIIYWL